MVVIAISGLPCVGTTTVGKLVARKLGLGFFSPGAYFKQHFRAEKEIDRALGFLRTGGSEKEFHVKLDKMQLDVAKAGDVVIAGKLSIYILKDLADLKVWLKADLNTRVKRLCERDELAIKEAKSKLKERESLERELWKSIYGIDYVEQESMADVVIDTSKKTPAQVAAQIIRNLKSKKKVKA